MRANRKLADSAVNTLGDLVKTVYGLLADGKQL
jgi:hypothetical protein